MAEVSILTLLSRSFDIEIRDEWFTLVAPLRIASRTDRTCEQ